MEDAETNLRRRRPLWTPHTFSRFPAVAIALGTLLFTPPTFCRCEGIVSEHHFVIQDHVIPTETDTDTGSIVSILPLNLTLQFQGCGGYPSNPSVFQLSETQIEMVRDMTEKILAADLELVLGPDGRGGFDFLQIYTHAIYVVRSDIVGNKRLVTFSYHGKAYFEYEPPPNPTLVMGHIIDHTLEHKRDKLLEELRREATTVLVRIGDTGVCRNSSGDGEEGQASFLEVQIPDRESVSEPHSNPLGEAFGEAMEDKRDEKESGAQEEEEEVDSEKEEREDNDNVSTTISPFDPDIHFGVFPNKYPPTSPCTEAEDSSDSSVGKEGNKGNTKNCGCELEDSASTASEVGSKSRWLQSVLGSAAAVLAILLLFAALFVRKGRHIQRGGDEQNHSSSIVPAKEWSKILTEVDSSSSRYLSEISSISSSSTFSSLSTGTSEGLYTASQSSYSSSNESDSGEKDLELSLAESAQTLSIDSFQDKVKSSSRTVDELDVTTSTVSSGVQRWNRTMSIVMATEDLNGGSVGAKPD